MTAVTVLGYDHVVRARHPFSTLLWHAGLVFGVHDRGLALQCQGAGAHHARAGFVFAPALSQPLTCLRCVLVRAGRPTWRCR